MATIGQLRKLEHIQKIFLSDDSLESVVASDRIDSILQRAQQQIAQRSFLRDERRRLRHSAERFETIKAALLEMRKENWFPVSIIEDNVLYEKGEIVRINVGGLMFHVPPHVLKRDPSSLLAKLASPDTATSILRDEDGSYYVDRDWYMHYSRFHNLICRWLFRYVLMFLRDGSLPEDRQLLAKLYREATFWNLQQLHLAIEEEKLHLRHISNNTATDKHHKLWWRRTPSWWEVTEGQAKATQAAAAKATDKKPSDWWKDTEYKGLKYGPISSDPLKVVTKEGEKDVKAMLSSTWSYETKEL